MESLITQSLLEFRKLLASLLLEIQVRDKTKKIIKFAVGSSRRQRTDKNVVARR